MTTIFLQEYFLNLSIQQELPLVMVGKSGTGKTFISTALIEGLSTEKFINNIVNFSARTNVNYTQGTFGEKFEREKYVLLMKEAFCFIVHKESPSVKLTLAAFVSRLLFLILLSRDPLSRVLCSVSPQMLANQYSGRDTKVG